MNTCPFLSSHLTNRNLSSLSSNVRHPVRQ
uniref:Uncharacterized protein n=1 Tax=Anguilla anguilla TaxID=7936 RepID=A0A0E9UC12_ANGAN